MPAIPPGTAAVGTGNPPADMNNVAGVLALLTGLAAGTTLPAPPASGYMLDTRYGTAYVVPPPTGATATDTPAVTAALNAMNGAGGNGTVLFQDGTYQVDSNALVIRNCSNFAVRGSGGTIITQAPNTVSKPNNVTGNLFTIADCTDFRVSDLTLDGLRDTVAPLTPLTALPASGQPSVTVAAGAGAAYKAGQRLAVFGGIDTADQALSDGRSNGWGGTGLVVQSVAAGAGAGGGDLITFTSNITSTYTVVSATVTSDGFGPYDCSGVYLTPYQTGYLNNVAGRSLSGEDQQNGLHLLACKRFVVSRVTARNLWESGIKCGAGWSGGYNVTNAADGCQHATISNCTAYHGYDQGISLWLCQNITVKGCLTNAPGWGGIVLTDCDYCNVTGNQLLNAVYRVPPDTADGNGIALEGSRFCNVIGNVILAPYRDGIRLWASPLTFGISQSSFCPTTSAFLNAQTVAGTSIQVSSTTHLQQGGLFSIVDGSRTEAVSVATIPDGTHITLNENLQFAHAAGVSITNRVPQDNVVEGNTIDSPQTHNGITNITAVRTQIRNNTIRQWNALSGSNQGINLVCGTSGAQSLPAPGLGGNGSSVTGNTLGVATGAGAGGHPILADSTDHLCIDGNHIWGPSEGSNTAAIKIQGVLDSVVSGNVVHDNGDSSVSSQGGLFLTTGTTNALPCARVVISGNVITRTKNEGIVILGGDSLTITGNKVSSCGGNAGIDLRGVTRSQVSDNISNSNASTGIKLEDNAGVFCLYNRVTGNTCRDDGTGINVKTGAAQTQQHGIVEAGTSNSNLLMANECDANALDQLTTVGAQTITHYNILSGTISA